jgi:hypothetical protein
VNDLKQELRQLQVEVSQLYGMLESIKQQEQRGMSGWKPPASETLMSVEPRSVETAFGVQKTGALEITVTQGKVYFKGVGKVIADWPALGVVDVTTNRFGWIAINLLDGSAAYAAGTTDPGDGDGDEEIVPIWKVTVADGIITEIVQCHPCDIHVYGNA